MKTIKDMQRICSKVHRPQLSFLFDHPRFGVDTTIPACSHTDPLDFCKLLQFRTTKTSFRPVISTNCYDRLFSKSVVQVFCCLFSLHHTEAKLFVCAGLVWSTFSAEAFALPQFLVWTRQHR